MFELELPFLYLMVKLFDVSLVVYVDYCLAQDRVSEAVNLQEDRDHEQRHYLVQKFDEFDIFGTVCRVAGHSQLKSRLLLSLSDHGADFVADEVDVLEDGLRHH